MEATQSRAVYCKCLIHPVALEYKNGNFLEIFLQISTVGGTIRF